MSNKENVATRIKSKIPKLVERVNSKEHRDPLKTLPSTRDNLQDQAGPSGVKRDKKSQKDPTKHPDCQPGPSGVKPPDMPVAVPDMRYVTNRRDPLVSYRAMRMPHGNIPVLDMRYVNCTRGDREHVQSWKYDVYKVFKDIDDIKTALQFEANAPTNQDPSAQEGLVTPAPAVPAQEKKSTQKKVKRSLKRAHTKELQSFASPTLKAVKKENLTTSQGAVTPGHQWPPVYAEDYVSDNITYLLSIEKRQRMHNSLRRTSMCCIVNWIINVNGSNGNPAVVQLACWYIDSYMNKATVALERLQLVAAACYWIAAKYHGLEVNSARLERWSAFAFTTSDFLAAERQVLHALNFPLNPCVVHDFVPYLCAFCNDASGALASAASFMALCVLLVYTFGSENLPSMVAAACVRCALRLFNDFQGIERLEECPLYKEAVQKAPGQIYAVTVLVRNAVRTVTSQGFEYKAPFNKYAGAPHYTALKITEAVNNPTIVEGDQRLKASAVRSTDLV